MARRSSSWTGAACAIGLCLLIAGAVGCGGQEKQEAPAATQTGTQAAAVSAFDRLDAAQAALVRKAAAIADAIEAAPATAAQVLAASGMTPSEFEDLIYRISADEQLSAAYAEARR